MSFHTLGAPTLAVLLALCTAEPSARAQSLPLEPDTGPLAATTTLELREALSLTLRRDPLLVGFAWEIRAREAEVVQAGVRPNPELELELENFAGSGEASGLGGAESTLSLSQLFEFGAKRTHRLRLAGLNTQSAQWDYEAARVASLTATTHAFLALLEAQAEVELAGRWVESATATLAAVEARLAAGSSSPVEVAQARVALSTTRADFALAQREQEARRSRLAARWASSEPHFERALGAFESFATKLTPLASYQQSAEQNPDLARWTSELERRRASIDAARAQRVPGLSAQAGLRHLGASDDMALVFGLSAPLPLFDRAQGSTLAAEHRTTQGQWDGTAARARIVAALATHHQSLVAAQEELVLLQQEALPQAGLALELARTAYQQGRVRLTEVLDIQRSYFELQARILRALARYHTSQADLESLIGAPMGEMP